MPHVVSNATWWLMLAGYVMVAALATYQSWYADECNKRIDRALDLVDLTRSVLGDSVEVIQQQRETITQQALVLEYALGISQIYQALGGDSRNSAP